MTLEELRKKIDVVDRQLVELLSERARAVLEIGHVKAASSMPCYEPSREKLVYAQVREANKGPLPDIEMTRIFERIIDVMRAMEAKEMVTEKNARANTPGHGTGAEIKTDAPETGNRQ